MDESINLVLACDDNYAQHAAITLMSAYEKSENKAKIESFVLDGGISEDKKEKIQKSIEQYGVKVSFIKISEDDYKGMYTSHQYSSAIYYRLSLPILLNKKKCIYVDCDLLFLDDIEKLWNINLNGHPLGAIEDIGLTTSKKRFLEKQKSIGLKADSSYFNSGVVIMDLEQWREKNYSNLAMGLAANNDFTSHDQDVLNKLFMDNWEQIDLRWNVIPPIIYMYPKIIFNKKERERSIKARKNPGILHYAGRYKAWEFKEYSEFNSFYYELLRKSAFKDVFMPQLSKQNVGKNFDKELFRIRLGNIIAIFL